MTENSDQVSHVETIELRGLKSVSNGTMMATTEILGCPMHVMFLRVKFAGDSQFADGDADTQRRYIGLSFLTHIGFRTIELEGFEGEWVMTLNPFQR